MVTDFHTTHRREFFSQSLTDTWRSSLKQQGAQEGQTTSRFSLLEFLQNQNKSDAFTEEYTDAVEAPDEDPANMDASVEDLPLDINLSSPEQSDQLANDFWSTPLEMGFDSYDTRVDPFSRMFDDWALAEP